MKGLVLAGGTSTRMGHGDKCLMKIRNKPLIEYSLDRMADLNLEEIRIVWGTHKAASIYGDYYRYMPLMQFVQFQPTGTIDAIRLASDDLNDDFYLMMGDEIMTNSRHLAMQQYFRRHPVDGLCGYTVANNLDEVKKTYSIGMKRDMKITHLEEKPKNPPTRCMGTGNCVLDSNLLRFIGLTPPNPERQERELVDWLQICIEGGKTLEAFDICDEYINVNTQVELEKAKKLLGEKRI